MSTETPKSVYHQEVFQTQVKITSRNAFSLKAQKEEALQILQEMYSGKTSKYGHVKKNSLEIVEVFQISLAHGSADVSVVVKADVCVPVENMIVSCKVVNVNRAGIKALVEEDDNVPMIVHICREHENNDQLC